jgi:hypothetical protein
MRKLLFPMGVILALLAVVGMGVAVADAPALGTGTSIALIPQLTPQDALPWYWCPTLSWGCTPHPDSFRSSFLTSTGVWDLGMLKANPKPGTCPQYFGATFGVAADATADAAYRITIWATACENPQMMTFTVDQNHAHTVILALQGGWRLEIQCDRLGGFGDAVMIEPQVFF